MTEAMRVKEGSMIDSGHRESSSAHTRERSTVRV
jgi:hypothetical protein